MTIRREVIQSPFGQGVDEVIAYSLTTTPWGATPSSPVVVVTDASADPSDVTSTVMPVNSPSILGDVITLSPLRALTEGHTYRVEIKFTAGGNVFETFFLVTAER
jgi:hypothetical protein